LCAVVGEYPETQEHGGRGAHPQAATQPTRPQARSIERVDRLAGTAERLRPVAIVRVALRPYPGFERPSLGAIGLRRIVPASRQREIAASHGGGEPPARAD